MGSTRRLCLRCVRPGSVLALPKRRFSSTSASPSSSLPALEHTSLSRQWLERTSIELSPEQVLKHEGGESLQIALAGLSSGTDVYVSMVNSDFAHFDKVVRATEIVADAGFRPIPHLPTARFETATSCSSTLERLRKAGAPGLLVVGGNDLLSRRLEGKCCYHSSGNLLEDQAKTLSHLGFDSISLAGHPGSGFEVLEGKIDTCANAGLKVTIASQFEFNTRLMLQWIHSLRVRFPEVRMAMGVPGITTQKRLRRISEICEVGSKDLPSLFDAMKRDSTTQGVVSSKELFQRFPELMVIEKAIQDICQAQGPDFIDRDAFARVLAAAAEVEMELGVETSREDRSSSHPSGPSPFTSGQADAASGPASRNSTAASSESIIAAPTDHVLAMAAYCERHQLAPGSLTAHLFPFGSLASTTQYLRDLKASFAVAH